MIKLFFLLFVGMSAYSQTIVETAQGKIEGYSHGEINIYKGIPFATPPTGDLRWKAPEKVKPWEGIKQCKEFGPSPIQNKPEPFLCWTAEFIAQPEPLSEDCLYLNIWTPAKKDTEKLAVFVWIYGGGLSSGSANCDIYDGEEMAKQGIVFVSINYRVGVLGFMAHPELSLESNENVSGNYGFMDQLQALKWVQENITAFGGDPNNVTIAGQSAGAFSVNAQIASPLSNHTFQKAICQSGSILDGRLMLDLTSAEEQGMDFMTLAGAKSIVDLRKISAEKLQQLSNDPKSGSFGVVLDGYFLPKDLITQFKAGKQNQVKILTGWVSGDGNLLPSDGTTVERFKKAATEKYGKKTKDFLSLLPADTDEEAMASQQKLNLLDYAGIPAYLLASYMATDVWLYEFTHVPTAKPNFPDYGAFHTSEVPFALHTLDKWDRKWKPEERDLENVMSAYWVNFAKEGNPNGAGLPQWNAYRSEVGALLLLDTDEIKMQEKYQKELKFLTQ